MYSSSSLLNGKLIITSIIDNLLKGASGQAVQNMNLMFGLNDGNKANCSAVAKHPGFAIFFEDLIRFFCNSGNP